MLEPRPNSTPIGLLRKIWPLADRRPKNSTGLATRYSATPPAGCLTMTDSPAAVLKPCQLIPERTVLWLMFSVAALGWEIVELPETTWPPVGSAKANCGTAKAALIATASACRRRGVMVATAGWVETRALRFFIMHSPEYACCASV